MDMKIDKDIDQILRHALSPEEEPDIWLNAKIINGVKEKSNMSNRKHKISKFAFCVILILAIGTTVAFTAWNYLKPQEVAENILDKKLATAFEGEDAIVINESQTYGNINVNLLGIVSGRDLSDFIGREKQVLPNLTYVVVAIKNVDGTPIEEVDNFELGFGDKIFVSPLINGLDPAKYNYHTMNGYYTDFITDGVFYRIVGYDNAEVFLNRGIYISVNDGYKYEEDAYLYNESTGDITRNEEYKGVNALFTLPKDEDKVLTAKEERHKKLLIDRWKKNEPILEDISDPADAVAYNRQLEKDIVKMKKLIKEGKLTPYYEENVQVKDGYIYYDIDYEDDMGGTGGSILDSYAFEDGKIGLSEAVNFGSDDKTVNTVTFTKEKDGTVTIKAYSMER